MSTTWFSERLPTLGLSAGAPELVLLHGWGMSSAVWRSWLPLLRRRCHVTLLDLPGFGQSPFQPGLNLEALLDQLAAHIPRGAALIGWSLGGALAAAFIERYPQHCKALMTLACNPCFVAREDWPTAMPVTVFEAFDAQLRQDARATLRRFSALQARGGDDERTLLKWLRETESENMDADALVWGLQLLRNLDTRELLHRCQLPAVHLYGSADALVPVETAGSVAALAPNQLVMQIDGAAHIPFASHGELCWQHLDRLLGEAHLLVRRARPQRDKKAVAESFSRAAASYDEAATLQRTVATQLLEQVNVRDGNCVLDIGCGTGFVSAALAARQDVIALDLAEGMVRHGRSRHPTGSIRWLCGDAENLPLADDSIDAAVSSLALQWCENLDCVFAEMRRVLRPQGEAWLATLGPETLAELRQAWAAVDDRVHVNRFAEHALIERALQRSELDIVQWREQAIVLEYADLRALTRELKALGAHNVNSGRPGGLTGRRSLQQLIEAYETRRNAQGLLPATWQLWFIQLRKRDG